MTSPAIAPKTLAASLLCAVLSMPATAFELFGPSCLEKLTERSRIWTECIQVYGRTGDQCKIPTARMDESMQACARKGKSKADIDAAMARGHRLAGHRPLQGDQQDVASKATRPGAIQSVTLDKISRDLPPSASPR